MRETAPILAQKFEHAAVFYGSTAEYLDAVLGFVADGLERADPVLVAVPGPKVGLLRDHLGEQAGRVSFTDMTVMGANPAWIIPRLAAFADGHRGGPVRYVGEPIWETRTTAELSEATRHEALINEALAAVPASALCPYDASGLGPAVLADARRTHPRIVQDGARRPSADYSGTAVARAIGGQPLPSPPPGARSTAFGEQDLPALRDQVSRRAVQEGISPSRAQDLVIAVHEIAANTVVHAGGAGILRIWRDGLSLVCEIGDDGRIRDPLAGRHPDSPHDDSGHGLRIAHELCDLVQLRSGPWGTTVRLHILAG